MAAKTEFRAEICATLGNRLARFAKYLPEGHGIIRVSEVRETPWMCSIFRLWESFISVWLHAPGPYDIQNIYDHAAGIAKACPCSARDIELFSVALASRQGDRNFSAKAGLLLTALVESCGESGWMVHTAHLSEPLEYLGYSGTRGFTINGNAGSFAGKQFFSGELRILGNAGFGVGSDMSGTGKIHVHGNAGTYAGYGMWSGSIHIHGNAGDNIGYESRGGEIHIDGEIGSIESNARCKVFHKGSLIRGN